MIEFSPDDEPEVTSLIEALYVAAGARRGTVRAAEWQYLAALLEAQVDTLPKALEPAP